MTLKVNQDIWVQVAGASAESAVKCVVTSVTPALVTIRLPDLRGMPSGLVDDCEVTLRVADEHGIHTATTRVRRTVTTPIAMIMVATPQRFSTKQNRKFFRVPAKLPVLCSIASSWDKAAIGRSDQAALTQDISAGGLRLMTALTLCVGDELLLEVKLRSPKNKETVLKLRASVSRVGLIESERRNKTVAGVEFRQTKREQDALVLLMFELQRASGR